MFVLERVCPNCQEKWVLIKHDDKKIVFTHKGRKSFEVEFTVHVSKCVAKALIEHIPDVIKYTDDINKMFDDRSN